MTHENSNFAAVFKVVIIAKITIEKSRYLVPNGYRIKHNFNSTEYLQLIRRVFVE
jgi:hypothetical protein